MVIRYMDYLVNPSFRIKHRDVFMYFFNDYYHQLEKDQSIFRLFKNVIAHNKCYKMATSIILSILMKQPRKLLRRQKYGCIKMVSKRRSHLTSATMQKDGQIKSKLLWGNSMNYKTILSPEFQLKIYLRNKMVKIGRMKKYLSKLNCL